MNPSIKKIGIPLAVVAIIGVIVYLVMKPSSETLGDAPAIGGSGLSSTVTNTPINPATPGNTPANDSVLKLLKNIDDLTLPTDVFSSNAFSLLSDGTVALPQRNDPGRRNPFSTLSGSGSATSTDPETIETPGNDLSTIVDKTTPAQIENTTTLPTGNTVNQIDKTNTLLKNTGIKKQN
jgi:hypothetical protein